MPKFLLLIVALAASSSALAGAPLKGVDVKLGKTVASRSGALPTATPRNTAPAVQSASAPQQIKNKGTVRGGIRIATGDRRKAAALGNASPTAKQGVRGLSGTVTLIK